MPTDCYNKTDELKEMIGFNAWSKLEKSFASKISLVSGSGNSQEMETAETVKSASINFRHV